MANRSVLQDTDRGRWLIRTATSTYELDLSKRVGVHIPGSDQAGSASKLRRDGDHWTLKKIVRCEIGFPMELLLQGVTPDAASRVAATVRTTTTVLAIDQL
jgi:hypothetical protein